MQLSQSSIVPSSSRRYLKVNGPDILIAEQFAFDIDDLEDRWRHFTLSALPASISYVITVNSSSHSLATIESALTNLDILLDLQVVLRGITSVSIPTFVDLSPLSVVSQPSFVPSRSPSIFIASVGGGHLRVTQVQH